RAHTDGCPRRRAETVCRPCATVGPWNTPFPPERILFSSCLGGNPLADALLLDLAACGPRVVVDLVEFFGPLLPGHAAGREVLTDLVERRHRVAGSHAQHGGD